MQAIHPTTPSSRHRFHLLDGLRGLAAIFVMLWHAPPYLLPEGGKSCYIAVDFFFCLSGFVIAFSYERRLLESMEFRSFARARIIRLFPTFLLGLAAGALSYLLLYIILSPSPDLRPHTVVRLCGALMLNVFMLPDLIFLPSPFVFPFNIAAWSLFYEMVANLAFGAMVKRRWLYGWLAVLAIVLPAVALGAYMVRGGSIDVGWERSISHLPLAIDRVTLSFTLGVLVHRLSQRNLLKQSHGKTAAWISMLLTILFSILLVSPWSFLRSSMFHLATVLMIFPLIVLVGATVSLTHWQAAVCTFLGDISYPLYLLHLPLASLLDLQFVRRLAESHPLMKMVLYPSTMLIVIAISYVVFTAYDRPVRRWLSYRISSGSFKRSTS